jgi:hypothetical protein
MMMDDASEDRNKDGTKMPSWGSALPRGIIIAIITMNYPLWMIRAKGYKKDRSRMPSLGSALQGIMLLPSITNKIIAWPTPGHIPPAPNPRNHAKAQRGKCSIPPAGATQAGRMALK